MPIFISTKVLTPRTMALSIQFNFRNKVYRCDIYIESTEHPCYVFITLFDKELINEFGDQVTIKTDCEKRLSKRDDYPELVELRQAIFDAVKTIPEFILAKRRMILLKEAALHHLYQS